MCLVYAIVIIIIVVVVIIINIIIRGYDTYLLQIPHVTVSILHFTVCLIFVLCQQADCNLSYPQTIWWDQTTLEWWCLLGFGKKHRKSWLSKPPSQSFTENRWKFLQTFQVWVATCKWRYCIAILTMPMVLANQHHDLFSLRCFLLECTCNFSASHKAHWWIAHHPWNVSCFVNGSSWMFLKEPSEFWWNLAVFGISC